MLKASAFKPSDSQLVAVVIPGCGNRPRLSTWFNNGDDAKSEASGTECGPVLIAAYTNQTQNQTVQIGFHF